MSLGLGDVSRKPRRAQKNSADKKSGVPSAARPVARSGAEASSQKQAKKPASSVAAEPAPQRASKTESARPWSTSGLARRGLSRKEAARDAHVSDEWAELQEAPLFWIDLRADSRVAALQERLAKLEASACNLALSPFAAFKKLRTIAKSTIETALKIAATEQAKASKRRSQESRSDEPSPVGL